MKAAMRTSFIREVAPGGAAALSGMSPCPVLKTPLIGAKSCSVASV